MANANLVRLRDALADRATWPEGFTWDYTDIHYCAIGLARDLGILSHDMTYTQEAETLGITPIQSSMLVSGLRHSNTGSMKTVMPEDVVTYMDTLIAEQDAVEQA